VAGSGWVPTVSFAAVTINNPGRGNRSQPLPLRRDQMSRPFRVAELDHVVLRCVDQKRACDFYTQELGLVEERRLDSIGLIQFRAGNSMVDLVPAKHPRADDAPNVDHYCLGIQTDDIGAVASYLRERGVSIIGEPVERYGSRGNGLSIYILDTEGNVVELKQMPK
jgi:glyoxylase I family protein